MIISLSVAAVAVILFSVVRMTGFRYRYPYHYALASELSLTREGLEEVAGEPDEHLENIFGMMVEASAENWERVLELAVREEKTLPGCYFYNLANAMMGKLGERLLSYYQLFEAGLFIPVGEHTSIPDLICSNEVWYQLGEMTMAEHHTILGMIYSPAHGGPRFYRRMAEINMVNGDEKLSSKYLALLGDTLDGKWKEKKKFIQKKDIVHVSDDVRPVLKGLIESNPDNLAAYEYLLCYDLLTKNIPAFIEDYVPGKKDCRLYQEVALVHLASIGDVSADKRKELGISEKVFRNFNHYNESLNAARGNADMLPVSFKSTYWYYFHFANRG
ncbi:MAG: hypothetical protein KBS57_03700 [Alistipes sp.]|nr:hypothetical protein [Candidatus Minthomonas equi]